MEIDHRPTRAAILASGPPVDGAANRRADG
jgi:hypothetical protein